MKKDNNLKSGQILIMVLLVLMILGITVVTVTNNLVKDTQESYQNIDYETLYSESETQIVNIAENLSIEKKAGDEIEALVYTLLGETGFTQDNGYIVSCAKYTDDPLTTQAAQCSISPDNTNAEIDMSDEPRIDVRVLDYLYINSVAVGKDESITFKIDPSIATQSNMFVVLLEDDAQGNPLSGRQAALEVILDFRYQGLDGQTRYSSVRGVYDETGGTVFSSGINNNIFSFNQEIVGPHSFRFSLNRVLLEIENQYTQGIVSSGSIQPVGLRFKPIIPGGEQSIFLTVTTDNYQQGIAQSRGITSTAYNINDNNEAFGPQPILEGNIPLHKSPSVFDYILRSGGAIQ